MLCPLSLFLSSWICRYPEFWGTDSTMRMRPKRIRRLFAKLKLVRSRGLRVSLLMQRHKIATLSFAFADIHVHVTSVSTHGRLGWPFWHHHRNVTEDATAEHSELSDLLLRALVPHPSLKNISHPPPFLGLQCSQVVLQLGEVGWDPS